jgi:protein disulfide-isomerase A1
MLVEFYAPWCGHCKKLAPEYAGAAQELAKSTLDPPVMLGKVDATVEKKLGERFGVQGFPTLFWFKKGEKQEYTGGRTKDTIVQWVTKKSGPPSAKVDCDTLKTKAKDAKFILAYFGAEGTPLFDDVHVAFANTEDKVQFFHVADDACAKEYKVTGPGIAFLRNFEEPVVPYTGAADKEALAAWVKPLMVPTVFEFTEEEIDAVFGQQQPTLMLFRDSATDKDAAFMTVFSEAATTHKGKMLFSYADVTGGIQERLAEFMGVTKEQMPTLRAILPEDMKKFKCDTKPADLTVAIIGKFADDVLSGAVKPNLKSEEIPEDNTGGVFTLVGKQWEEVVMDPTKDVLVKYYAPWCGHCKKLVPVWEQLGETFANEKNLVIAKFDATANEADGVQIGGYPTLIFYPKDNKAGVTYEGDRDIEGFTKYLTENSAVLKEAGNSAKAEL